MASNDRVGSPDADAELLGQPFRIDSISEAPAPHGSDGLWQQYVIVQGSNTITGLRPGTADDVRLQVEEIVRNLNARFAKSQTGLGSNYARRGSAPRAVKRGLPLPAVAAAEPVATDTDASPKTT